jgi:hypothetical protein
VLWFSAWSECAGFCEALTHHSELTLASAGVNGAMLWWQTDCPAYSVEDSSGEYAHESAEDSFWECGATLERATSCFLCRSTSGTDRCVRGTLTTESRHHSFEVWLILATETGCDDQKEREYRLMSVAQVKHSDMITQSVHSCFKQAHTEKQ